MFQKKRKIKSLVKLSGRQSHYTEVGYGSPHSGCNDGLQKQSHPSPDAFSGFALTLAGTDFGGRLNSMYRALLKSREWLPKGTFQCLSPSGSQPGAPQVFLSPQGSTNISAACQHLSLALPRLPRTGITRGTQAGQPGWRSRIPMPEDGQLGIWLLLTPLHRQEGHCSSRNRAIVLGDGDWATAGAKPTQQLWHKLQKYRRAVDGWAVGRWDRSLPDSRRLLWTLHCKSN